MNNQPLILCAAMLGWLSHAIGSSAATVAFDDFEPGIDRLQWAAFGGTVLATNYGGSVSGANSLWFGGEGPRFAVMGPFDTSTGGWIDFWLRIPDYLHEDSHWSSPHLPQEGIVLEYSVNGGADWLNWINYFIPEPSWSHQLMPIDSAARSPATRFRWRQLTNSSPYEDNWALDDVALLVEPTGPMIFQQPISLTVYVGGTASFHVDMRGNGPFLYQWRFNGVDLPGQTNAQLSLAGLTTNQAGSYAVAVSNPVGMVLSSNALLRIIDLGGDVFQITSLATNGTGAVQIPGDSDLGLAASETDLLVPMNSGSGQAAFRYALADLSGAVRISRAGALWLSDLRSGVVFALANGTNWVGPYNGTVTTLLEVDQATGLLTGHSLPLSAPIELTNGFGVFAGYGRIGLYSGAHVYDIALPSGTVTDLGPTTIRPTPGGYQPPFWGIMEFCEGKIFLVYTLEQTNVVRTRVPDGQNTTLLTIAHSEYWLGEVITAAPRWNCWYMRQWQYLKSAEASFTNSVSPPELFFQPEPQIVDAGDTATFAVTPASAPPLLYQWRFNGNDLPGATNRVLRIPGVTTEQAGAYSVAVSNPLGTITSSNALLTVLTHPPAITLQPTNQTVTEGGAVTFTAWVSGTPPFFHQWQFNGADLPGRTNPALTLNGIAAHQAGGYRALISNSLGSVTSLTATLTVTLPSPRLGAGSVDLSFDPTFFGEWTGILGGPGAVAAMAQQPDGKVVVGGVFSAVERRPQNALVRLYEDGTRDPSFQPGLGPDDRVLAVAIPADGKILIGGVFTNVAGVPRRALARLYPDGSLDYNFCPSLTCVYNPDYNTTGQVNCVVVQPDGKLLIGGDFIGVNGVPRPGLARLHPDGSLDQSFEPAFGSYVIAITPQADGKVLVAKSYWGTQPPFVRLNEDGTFDTAFEVNLRAFLDRTSGGVVTAMAVQSDGKIYLGGTFVATNTGGGMGIARLHPDGRVDSTFANGASLHYPNSYPPPAAQPVSTILLQRDGKVIFAGGFDHINGGECPGLVRFDAEGRVDPTFSALNATGPGGTVNAVVLSPEGLLTAGGSFYPSGWPLRQIIRLEPNGAFDTLYQLSLHTPGRVTLAAVQPDNMIVIAGAFTAINELDQPWLARLYPDGSPDDGFRPTFTWTWFYESVITDLALQPDGKIVISGEFNTVNGTARSGFARLQTDGTLDYGFYPTPGFTPDSFAIQTDGRIVVGGDTTWQPAFARVNSDGSRDYSFNAGSIHTPQETGWGGVLGFDYLGRSLIIGNFSSINGVSRAGFARLYINGGVDTGFNPPWRASSLLLQPDGNLLLGGLVGSCSLWRITTADIWDLQFSAVFASAQSRAVALSPHCLALQADGKILITGNFDTVNSTPRRAAARVQANGRLDPSFDPGSGPLFPLIPYTTPTCRGVAVEPEGSILVWGDFRSFSGVPASGIVRLQGGDEWLSLTSQPTNLVRAPGENADFTVAATGTLAISYRWQFNGTDIPGATSPTLTVPAVDRRDAGLYRAVVSNPAGSMVSREATLTVRVPQRLALPIRLPDGTITLSSQDSDGGTLFPEDLPNFEVLASTNLTLWSPLPAQLTLSNGCLRLRDLQSTNYPFRFYQIMERLR